MEAKAHAGELDRGGIALGPDASAQAARNFGQIERCLGDAATGLRRLGHRGVRIDRGTHYQLANRVATAWKLAECGLPVALLYLGFLGDAEVGVELVDADHWQRVVGSYFDGVLPLDLPGRVLPIGRGSLRLVVQALHINDTGRIASG